MTRAADPTGLSELALFKDLSSEQLSKLAPLLQERAFPGGAGVITAEEPGAGAYVVLFGSVKVHVLRPDGAEVILAVLGPGELVGEMSLADSLGRPADVVALEGASFL